MEESDRIPNDDMGEFNGQNIEDEAIVYIVTIEIDGSVWMLSHPLSIETMYTLQNLWEIEVKQDEQNQRKVIEEKTRTGKAPTKNELELKVSDLVIIPQSK